MFSTIRWRFNLSDKDVNKSRKVFVVHGRNEKIRKSIFAFLRAIGLHPYEWTELSNMTGTGSPYIGEILEKGFNEAQAIVVVFTPDDEARLYPFLQKFDDPTYEKILTGQARPNVLFEAGLAFGKQPSQTILVQIDKIRPFSDIAGRHLIKLDNSSESRQNFAQRLKTAGCKVDLTGTDWHKEGDFSINVAKIEDKNKKMEENIEADTSQNNLKDKTDEQINRLTKDSRIPPQKLKSIFDFDADSDIPPLLCKIEGDTRIQQQRIALYLILYANNLLKQNNSVNSSVLGNVLEKSNIDPSNLNKAIIGISNHIRIDRKFYRITPPGIVEARRILTIVADKL